MPKFSIVIPCYNSFKYMEKCLDSLEKQTFTDFEVIFIDDNSNDNTFEEIKKFDKKTKLNIKVLKNSDNFGPGKTRNIGIDNASGKYITFVDADDYIENYTFEVLNNIIEKEKVDCIIYDYYYKTSKNIISQKSLLKGKSGIINKSDALIYSTGSTWCKVYELEKIRKNKIEFPDFKRNEDMVFNKLAISVSENIYYCSKNLYYYVKRESSLVNNQSLLNEQNAIKGFAILEKNFKEKYDYELSEIFVKEYFYTVIMTYIYLRKNLKEIKQEIKKCEEKYPDIYKKQSIKYFTTYQKLCLLFIKNRCIFLLRFLIRIKEFIKRIR